MTDVEEELEAILVAMRGEGQFTVVWSGRGTQPGQIDSQGVFAQNYTREQAPVAVDDDTAGYQRNAV